MNIPFTPSFRTTVGLVCLAFGLLGGIIGGPLGGIIVMPIMLVAGLCLAGPIGGFVANLINGMVYRKSYLKEAPQRIAAAETLATQRKFEEAQEAFEAILAEEPDNLPALLAYAKMLLAWQRDEARFEVADMLSTWLARQEKPQPGCIAAVMLLADLLQEEGRFKQTQEMLEQEFAKGYCHADENLIRLRLKSLDKQHKGSITP